MLMYLTSLDPESVCSEIVLCTSGQDKVIFSYNCDYYFNSFLHEHDLRYISQF